MKTFFLPLCLVVRAVCDLRDDGEARSIHENKKRSHNRSSSMNTPSLKSMTQKLTTMAALALATLVVTTSTAQADDHFQPRLRPPYGGSSSSRVLLGFSGRNVGYGVEVLRVNRGSTADRLGLERGDVVVGVNGRPVHCLNDYYRQLGRAGGHVWLEVIDIRTGYSVETHSEWISGSNCRPPICYH
jgi:S1-C subfamily serine protease